MDTHEIKTDCRGRTWRSAEVRQELIEEYRGSGFSVAAFCDSRDINPGTFYGWLANERGEETEPVFREVAVVPPPVEREVRIYHLSCGRRLNIKFHRGAANLFGNGAGRFAQEL